MTALITGLLGFEQAQAQSGDNSPYSSYGFGDLVGTTQVSQALMGGVGIGLADPYSVITSNPASYTSLMRPCFEIGGVGHFVRLGTAETQSESSNGRFLGLSLGVPFGKNRWGVALGVQPVSEVGYRIEDHVTLPDGEDVRLDYRGSGGLNRAYIGIGWAIWQQRDSLGNGHRLSIGSNFNYLFGSVDQTRTAYYPSNSGYYDTNVFTALVMRNWMATAGLQYQGDLVRRRTKEGDGLRYIIGLSTDLGPDLLAHRTDVITNFQTSTSGITTTYDTIAYHADVPGTVSLPPSYGGGLSVFNAKWTGTVEVRTRDWRELKINVEEYDLPSSLGRSTTYAMGLAWRPAGDRIGGSFWARSIWRFGLRYADDYLIVEGAQLSETGMSLGASLPLLGSISRSRFNLGAEFGQRGPGNGDGITESFVDVYLGLTITPDLREPWFKKKKIE